MTFNRSYHSRNFLFVILAVLLFFGDLGVSTPRFTAWAAHAEHGNIKQKKPVLHKIRRLIGLRKARVASKKTWTGRLRIRLPRDNSVHQIMAHNFDWDENVMRMPTLVYLVRNSDGREFPFSTVEFAALRAEIGKEKTWFADYDDHKNGAIRDFRDYSLPERFRLDTKKALKIGAWAENALLFQKWLDSPITARWTFVTTTRGHARERLYDGVSLLFEEGYARHLMPKENLVGITYPEGLDVNGEPMPQVGFNERKIFTHKQRLDEITSVPLGNKAIELVTPNGDQLRAMHTYEFSDDDLGFFETTVEYFKANQHKWPNVKLIVSYTGELDLDGPRRVVVTDKGETREFGKATDGTPLPAELTEVERSVKSQED